MLKERIEARIEAYEDMVIGLSNENKFKKICINTNK